MYQPTQTGGSPENRRKAGNAWRAKIDDLAEGLRVSQSGRPPKALHDLQELARQHTPEAIETLVKIMRNDNHPQQGWAADKLLDRGWGRPIVPTVQTTTGKTFEQWLDTLDDHAKQLIDEDIARVERGELADVEPNGSA